MSRRSGSQANERSVIGCTSIVPPRAEVCHTELGLRPIPRPSYDGRHADTEAGASLGQPRPRRQSTVRVVRRGVPLMGKISLTVATWDYDRVRPLIDGRVRVEGCDINFITVPPEECFHRAWNHQEFDVTEIGLSGYIIAVSRASGSFGLSPYVAIPVFLSRSFRCSGIYIRTDRGIESPHDLQGRKIGVPEYQ